MTIQDRLAAVESANVTLSTENAQLRQALRVIRKGLSDDADGEFWSARRWLDARNIYHGDLSGHRVLELVAKHVLHGKLAECSAPSEPPRRMICRADLDPDPVAPSEPQTPEPDACATCGKPSPKYGGARIMANGKVWWHVDCDRPAAPVTGDAPPQPSEGRWTCFHCGETFTTPGSARDHFGAWEGAVAGCLIDQVAVEEGGKPERGRGLLMALRKAELKISEMTRKLYAAQEQADAPAARSEWSLAEAIERELDASEPRPSGGQQVGPSPAAWHMTPTTRSAMRRLLRDWRFLKGSPDGPSDVLARPDVLDARHRLLGKYGWTVDSQLDVDLRDFVALVLQHAQKGQP